jgi:hypothetical protein
MSDADGLHSCLYDKPVCVRPNCLVMLSKKLPKWRHRASRMFRHFTPSIIFATKNNTKAIHPTRFNLPVIVLLTRSRITVRSRVRDAIFCNSTKGERFGCIFIPRALNPHAERHPNSHECGDHKVHDGKYHICTTLSMYDE